MLTKSREFNSAVIFMILAIVFVDIDAQSSCRTPRMGLGVCVPILTCETIINLLNSAPKPLSPAIVTRVQQSHCGTSEGIHYVCCETNSVSGGRTVTPSTTVVKSSRENSKIRQSVDKSDENVQIGMAILEATKCGYNNDDRISNGVDANLSEYPWMALLVYNDSVITSLHCGGSLITDQYVLTAAHCLLMAKRPLTKVRLGEHDIGQTIDCSGTRRRRKCAPPVQEIDIEEAIYCKDYIPSQFRNDIGLIRLASKVVIGVSVRPICLPITPSSLTASLQRMIIAGWGRIESGPRASVLQKAVMTVRTNDYCQEIHKIIQFTDSQICAGGEDGIDTCKGDSGGPIFISARYRSGARYVQYGIVAAGGTECGSNFPSIYARVTSFIPWIAGNIRP